MYPAHHRGAYPKPSRSCPGSLTFDDCLGSIAANQRFCHVCDLRRTGIARPDPVNERPRFPPPPIPKYVLRQQREAVNARLRALSLDGGDAIRMPQPAQQAHERATRPAECHYEPAAAAATDVLLSCPPTQGPLLNKCTINFYNSNIAPGRRKRPRPPPPAPAVVEQIREVEVEEEVRIPMFAPHRARPSMRPDSRVSDRYGFEHREWRGRSPARSFGNPPSRFNNDITLLDGRSGEVSHYPGVSHPRGRAWGAARSPIPIPIVPVRGAQQFERPRYNSQVDINTRYYPDCPSPTISELDLETRRLRDVLRELERPYEPARARNRAAADGVRARRVRDRWESDSSTEIDGLVQRCEISGSRGVRGGRGATSPSFSSPSAQVSDSRRMQTATDDERGPAYQGKQDGLRRPSSVVEGGGDATEQLAGEEFARQPDAARMSTASCSTSTLVEQDSVQEARDSEE